jgi:molybdenum cofactor biosynthesis enzyme MoaA
MSGQVRLTKNCIEPWRAVQFEAGGIITPCCSGTITGDFGNLITDPAPDMSGSQERGWFNTPDYQALRKGLLTGELPRACITCRSVHENDIPVDQLRLKVRHHLKSQGVCTEGIELESAFAFSECGGNITNRCNFSCVYCSHSGEDGHTGHLRREMEREHFLKVLDCLCRRGLKIFNFCGIGELTTYSGWVELVDLIEERYPELRLRVISNFGRLFSDPELDRLAHLDLVHISCDTLDPRLYAGLRRGGRLPLLLENIRRLKDRCSGQTGRAPDMVFNVTATDANVDHLEDLFRFAAQQTMFVHISNLFVMNGSVASKTGCVRNILHMPEKDTLRVRETLHDLPRRMKAENPLTQVWEYSFLHSGIMNRADRMTYNQFVPADDQVVNTAFYQSQPKNPDAYLRKIWTSFDTGFSGIYLRAGHAVSLALVGGPKALSYKAVWCHEREDGNLDVWPGPVETISIGDTLTLSSEHCGTRYDAVLFHVVSELAGKAGEHHRILVAPEPPKNADEPVLVREAFLRKPEDRMAQQLVDSHESLVLWCAGLRALHLLSNTCLGQANIHMIIDGNPRRAGEVFCGRTIYSPQDLRGFSGKIVVTHASSPEQVAVQIRSMGIRNEIVIL